VASSALAAGSRLSQGPTASSTSAACATACAPEYASRAEVLRRAGLTHPHTPPCQSTGCQATATAQHLHSRQSSQTLGAKT